MQVSLAAIVVRRKSNEKLVVVSVGVYSGLVLIKHGLGEKERWRKKTVPLVRSPAI